MSAQNPTPDDLRTIAKNLKAEGQTSRAEVIENAANEMQAIERQHEELIEQNGELELRLNSAREYGNECDKEIEELRAAAREVLKQHSDNTTSLYKLASLLEEQKP